MKSRNEIDFLRLLWKCQEMSYDGGWRLEKYIDALSDKLEKLRCQNVNLLTRDTLEEYGRKVQFLRGLIETEKLPSAEKRLLATELLAPDKETKSIHLIAKNRYHQQMRQDLLTPHGKRHIVNAQTNRNRRSSVDDDVADDITQNLLELTNNIRESMHAANAIIQKDTETLTKASGGADVVSVKMQRNTDKLSEFASRGCQLAIWITLILTTCTFLMMVIFIRLFPKQR